MEPKAAATVRGLSIQVDSQPSRVVSTRGVVVGRSPLADIHIDHPLVAAQHVRISLDSLGWTVQNLSPDHGMYVEGVEVDRLSVYRNLVLRLGSALEGPCVSLTLGPGNAVLDIAEPAPTRSARRRADAAQAESRNERTNGSGVLRPSIVDRVIVPSTDLGDNIVLDETRESRVIPDASAAMADSPPESDTHLLLEPESSQGELPVRPVPGSIQGSESIRPGGGRVRRLDLPRGDGLRRIGDENRRRQSERPRPVAVSSSSDECTPSSGDLPTPIDSLRPRSRDHTERKSRFSNRARSLPPSIPPATPSPARPTEPATSLSVRDPGFPLPASVFEQQGMDEANKAAPQPVHTPSESYVSCGSPSEGYGGQPTTDGGAKSFPDVRTERPTTDGRTGPPDADALAELPNADVRIERPSAGTTAETALADARAEVLHSNTELSGVGVPARRQPASTEDGPAPPSVHSANLTPTPFPGMIPPPPWSSHSEVESIPRSSLGRGTTPTASQGDGTQSGPFSSGSTSVGEVSREPVHDAPASASAMIQPFSGSGKFVTSATVGGRHNIEPSHSVTPRSLPVPSNTERDAETQFWLDEEMLPVSIDPDQAESAAFASPESSSPRKILDDPQLDAATQLYDPFPSAPLTDSNGSPLDHRRTPTPAGTTPMRAPLAERFAQTHRDDRLASSQSSGRLAPSPPSDRLTSTPSADVEPRMPHDSGPSGLIRGIPDSLWSTSSTDSEQTSPPAVELPDDPYTERGPETIALPPTPDETAVSLPPTTEAGLPAAQTDFSDPHRSAPLASLVGSGFLPEWYRPGEELAEQTAPSPTPDAPHHRTDARGSQPLARRSVTAAFSSRDHATPGSPAEEGASENPREPQRLNRLATASSGPLTWLDEQQPSARPDAPQSAQSQTPELARQDPPVAQSAAFLRTPPDMSPAARSDALLQDVLLSEQLDSQQPSPHNASSLTMVAERLHLNSGPVIPITLPEGDRSPIIIGRAIDCDMPIEDQSVSRHHARLESTRRGPLLVDLSSRNGTYINGQRISRQLLEPGDLVTIGNSDLIVEDGKLEENPASAVTETLAVHHLDYHLPQGQQLLDDVSFTATTGTLTAVIGPSGAGKSTLVKVLSGECPPSRGNVVLSELDVHESYDAVQSRIGVVPQDDVVHRHLTVGQALEYAACLRLPTDTTRAERSTLIDKVLSGLDLRDRLDTRVGSLSGGQRKRVSIAIELLTAPTLLILDEPTSGLDPALDRQVMYLLRELADQGHIVVVVTHSLSYLSVCDSILIMAPGGTPAYLGNLDGLTYRFGTSDWAEIFAGLQNVSRVPSGAAAGEKPKVRPPKRIRRPMRVGVAQFVTIARRQIRLILADRGYLAFLLALPVVLGTLALVVPGKAGFGVAESDAPTEASQLLVLLILGASFMGAALTIRDLVGERVIYFRERSAGLSPMSYLLAKTLVFGGFIFFQSAVLVLIVAGVRGSPTTSAWLPSGTIELFIGVAMTAWASSMVALCCSAAVRSMDQVMPALVVIVMTQLVLSGGMVPVSNRAVLQEVSYLFPSRWGFAATASTVDLRSIIERSQPDALWVNDPQQWLLSIAILGLISLVSFIVTKIMLTRRDSRKALSRRRAKQKSAEHETAG